MTDTIKPAIQTRVSGARENRKQDIALIKQTVARLDKAQRDRNPDGFMALLTRQAVWVTALGKRMTGWDEINSFTRQVLTQSLGDDYASYTVEHISFLGSEVAAVNVRQRPVNADKQPVPDAAEGRPLYVMIKSAGQWQIAVGQNTRYEAQAIKDQRATLKDRKSLSTGP